MKIKDKLHKEIDSLPDEFAGEVLDFVQFVKSKYQKEKKYNIEARLFCITILIFFISSSANVINKY